jgi:hypothetical protein
VERVTVGEAIDYLQNGTIFLKYGKRGNPHPRHVYLVQNRIFWSETGMMGNKETKKTRKN